jgi:hypothetical protein
MRYAASSSGDCFAEGRKRLVRSRVVDRRFVLKDLEREQFRMFLRM